jgi:6,7-dimethyl-8-ribityllumazine synthase
MADGQYAICVGNFYEDLADRLVEGARAEFARSGVSGDRLRIFEVPGAFELPLAAHYCATSGEFVGVVCLGAVIRGETDHYDFVCGEAARGIQNVQLSTGVPCGFGVLTVENMEQALARTDGSKRDQGAGAARAVLRMNEIRIDLLD